MGENIKLNEIFIYPLHNSGDELDLEIEFYLKKLNARIFLLSEALLDTARDIKSIISKVKKAAKTKKLLFGIHAGGGDQLPVEKNISLIPSNMSVGLSDDPENAYKTANVLANELKALGIDFVISDFLNVNMHSTNAFVGTRSFLDNSDKSEFFIKKYIKGFEDAGIILIGEGFPGIGSLQEFNKDRLNTIHRSLKDMYEHELMPYKHAFDAELSAVSINDIYYFKESKTVKESATFSVDIIDFLKETMQYKGVVVSSPLYKKVFSSEKKEDLVIKAYKAGCNLIIMPGTLKENILAYNNFFLEYKKGNLREVAQEDVNGYQILKSLSDVSKEKSLYYLKKENKKLIENIIKDGVTIFHGNILFTEFKNFNNILVVAPDIEYFSEVSKDNYFIKAVKYYKRKCDSIEYSASIETKEIDDIKKKAADYDGVLYFSFNSHLNHTRENLGIALYRSNSNTVIAGIDSPYEYKIFEETSCYVAICSFFDIHIKAFCERLFKG